MEDLPHHGKGRRRVQSGAFLDCGSLRRRDGVAVAVTVLDDDPKHGHRQAAGAPDEIA